jgi:glycosyltransferase involved in cell wall biosynthesis
MGTRTHGHDFFDLVAPAFERLHRRLGAKVALDVIGVVDFAPADAPWRAVIPPNGAVCYPAFATWLQSQRGYSVGLAPLMDNPFNIAKSNIKLLEYAALGMASVAADLPPYRNGGTAGFGLLVEPTADAFFEAMLALATDPRRRRKLQESAVSTIARLQRETTQVRLDLIEQLVDSTARRRDMTAGCRGDSAPAGDCGTRSA